MINSSFQNNAGLWETLTIYIEKRLLEVNVTLAYIIEGKYYILTPASI